MVRKHLIVYSPINDETAAFIASHFDMVDFDFDYTVGFEKIKALNPQLIMVGYRDIFLMLPEYEDWTEVNANEDWFLHDINGNRLQTKKGAYAMDVGNSGWREYYANFVKAKLSTYPMVDGIFADNAWEARTLLRDPWTVPVSQVPSSIHDNWNANMAGMIQYVKNALGNKLLVINSNEDHGYFLQYCDGQMLEGFLHGNWSTPDEFPDDPYSWFKPLYNLSASNKYVLAQTGVKYDATKEDKMHQIGVYGLAAAYVASNGSKVSFGFSRGTYADVHKSYIPEMDVEVGNPRGAYYQLNPDVYGRDFDHAKVFVNFSSDKTYEVTTDGIAYTLPPHSGVIAPWEAPTPAPPIIQWWNSLLWWQKVLVIAGGIGAAGGAVYGYKKLKRVKPKD